MERHVSQSRDFPFTISCPLLHLHTDYTVVDYDCIAKINLEAPLDKACFLGCGIATGVGAVFNKIDIEIGDAFHLELFSTQLILKLETRCAQESPPWVLVWACSSYSRDVSYEQSRGVSNELSRVA
jgi:hypothetical protein